MNEGNVFLVTVNLARIIRTLGFLKQRPSHLREFHRWPNLKQKSFRYEFKDHRMLTSSFFRAFNKPLHMGLEFTFLDYFALNC